MALIENTPIRWKQGFPKSGHETQNFAGGYFASIRACIVKHSEEISRLMPLLAIIFGLLLDALGVVGFVASGATHLTALIPAIFGTFIFVSGLIAYLKPNLRKHAMHVAALFGLLGTLGGLGMGLPKLFKFMDGTATRSEFAIFVQVGMGVICLVFVVLCVKSFIAARRAGVAAK